MPTAPINLNSGNEDDKWLQWERFILICCCPWGEKSFSCAIETEAKQKLRSAIRKVLCLNIRSPDKGKVRAKNTIVLEIQCWYIVQCNWNQEGV